MHHLRLRPAVFTAFVAAVAAVAALGGAASGAEPRPAALKPWSTSLHQPLLRLARASPGVAADVFVAAQRRSPRCHGHPGRLLRSGPNKYALGSCGTAARADGRAPQHPRTRLLHETSFASVVADDTCVSRDCAAAARRAGATWVLVGGRAGVRPRTIADCPRYKNVDFATDLAIDRDRMPRTIPKGTQVLWRYATRGGGWVMARWSRAAGYAWAFIPRTCVSDPPRWSEIGLWRTDHHAAGRHRPQSGRRFRVLRPALPCAGRLRCHVAPAL